METRVKLFSLRKQINWYIDHILRLATSLSAAHKNCFHLPSHLGARAKTAARWSRSQLITCANFSTRRDWTKAGEEQKITASM